MTIEQPVRIFSYLKNTDLHAVSARETLISLLGVKNLAVIRRLGLFEVTFDKTGKGTPEETDAMINKILTRSYYLINPNKEGYELHTLSRPAALQQGTEPTSLYLIKVIPKEPANETDTVTKIRRHLDVPVQELHSSLLWEITVKGNPDKNEITTHLIEATTRQAGILINPVSHTFQYLNPDDYYH